MAATDGDDRAQSTLPIQKLKSLITGTIEAEPEAATPEWPLESGIGVCCSGGGIRSASYCLGALQGLQERGELQKADYLASVSGGGYIAGSITMVAGSEEQDLVWGDGCPAPFAPNSPEQKFLRNHSSYLAYGGWGKLRLVLRLLLGMLVNLAFLGALIVIIGRVIGHFARWARPDLVVRSTVEHGPHWLVEWILNGARGLLVLGLALLLLTTLRRLKARDEDTLFVMGCMVLGCAALIAFTFAWLPAMIHFLREILVPDVQLVREPAKALGVQGEGDAAGSSMIARLFGVLSALGLPAMLIGALRTVLKENTSRFGMFAAGLVVPLLIAFAFLAVTNDAADSSWGREDLVWLAGAGIVLVALLTSDLTATSMHPFYKRRLASAFALERIWQNERNERDRSRPRPPGRLSAQERDYEDLIPLSGTKPAEHDWPTWVCCAAANISDEGRTPPGRNAVTFTFDSEWIGGPEVGYIKTTMYEEAMGKRRKEDITIPAAIAVSGAALSPSMGGMTKPSLRMLLAVVNGRLGVWIPSPKRVKRWIEEGTDATKPFRSRPPFVRLLREMVGNNKANSKFLYVTDGGHWENLGLVELLRRGCKEIYCFDAAGDKEETFFTLGEAIALARDELGVEIEITPDNLRRKDPQDPTYALTDHVYGTFSYPPDDNGRVETGRLVFAKATVTNGAPWDVRAYREKDPTFPNHSLLAQMFADETFESYRALGLYTAGRAFDTMQRKRRDAQRAS